MTSATTEITFLCGRIDESLLGNPFEDGYDEASGPKPPDEWVPVNEIPDVPESDYGTYVDPLVLLLREQEDWYTDELIEAYENQIPKGSPTNLNSFYEDFSPLELELVYLSAPDFLIEELVGSQTPLSPLRAPNHPRTGWYDITRDNRHGPKRSSRSHVPGKRRYRRETIRHR